MLPKKFVLLDPAAWYMQSQKAKPLELAHTALARMAAANGNGDAALEAAEQGQRAGVPARLRTFAPALLAFAVAGQVDKAFQVSTSCIWCAFPDTIAPDAILSGASIVGALFFGGGS